jgi:hypothetical protein
MGRIRNNETTKEKMMIIEVGSEILVDGMSFFVVELQDDCLFATDEDGEEWQIEYSAVERVLN